MSQQIQITGGAKVRDLQDVIIGTSGVLSSLAFDVANGVPKLDSNGKILVSQLPNSVMEYKGTWNAATNTPTLVNGTGNQGDVYLCNVAGTVNFGAGPIAFVVGDQVIYSGSIWQRASGATGTVTSVALTESGDSLNITGSPISTSGTINIGFNGTNLQYVNGAGNLTTFPTLITSIGLSMPSAFSVANSPLTANGTIAVTGAGVASQYIRGDGTLADFPTSGGGGSSVSYYLNGGTSQGTIGGTTYYEMSKTAVIGTGVDFAKTGDGFIVAFLTDANDPAQLNIPAGNWNYEIYASMSSNGGTPEMYAELYVYDGTTFTLISTSPHEILYDGTALNLYTFAMAVPATSLTLTDRLAIKLYATNSGGKTTTIHTQDSHLCQIITTFSTGITALNGLTAQVQYFQVGTSGTDFNISSTTATHTFNIPDASASARGLITTGTQTIAGDKAFTGINSFDYGINYKTGASLANVSGYISQAYATSGTGAGSTLSLKISDGNSVKAINLDFVGAPATYTYTFPAASGTVALTSQLGSYLPLAGGIMTGSLLLNNNIPIQGQLFGTSSYATMMIMSPSNKILIDGVGLGVIFGGTIGQGAYTYTFPSASGTIALTSSLSSYVPYTGATTDLNLGLFNLFANSLNTQSLEINTIGGGNAPINFYMSSVQKASISASLSTLTFSAKNTNGFQFQNPSNAIIFSISNTGVLGNGTYSYTLPSATGTLALTSDLSGMITGSGTTNYLPKFTGASTIGDSAITDVSGIIKIGTTASTTYGTLTIVQQSVAAPSFVRGIQLVHPNGTGVTGGYLGISVSGQKQGQIQVGDDSNVGDLIINPAGGNLGLGVTPSAWSGSTGFQVQYATVEGRSSLPSFAEYAANSYSDAGVRKYIASDYASRYTQYQSNHYWFTAPSGTAGAAITFTQAMTLLANGNLLIGTTSDNTHKLQISAANPFMTYTSTAISRTFLSGVNSNGYVIYDDTASAYRMAITSGGNVLIGTTTDSGYKLDVNGTGRFSGDVTIIKASAASFIANNTSASGKSYRLVSTDAGTFIIQNTGILDLVTITSAGAATFSASIQGGGLISTTVGNTNQALKLSAATGFLQFTPYYDATYGAFINSLNTAASAYLPLTIQGSKISFLQGNVLIGTTTDDTVNKLQVNGSAKISGSVGINGNINASYKLTVTGNTYITGDTSTGADISLLVQNSSSTTLFYTRNDGLISTGLAANSPYNNSTGTVANAIFASDGTLQRSTVSSIRYKENINDWTGGLDIVLALKPKTFQYKKDYYNKADIKFLGLIAEDVAIVSPYLADYENEDRTGQVENVRYANIVVPLIKAIQELNEKLVRNNIN